MYILHRKLYTLHLIPYTESCTLHTAHSTAGPGIWAQVHCTQLGPHPASGHTALWNLHFKTKIWTVKTFTLLPLFILTFPPNLLKSGNDVYSPPIYRTVHCTAVLLASKADTATKGGCYACHQDPITCFLFSVAFHKAFSSWLLREAIQNNYWICNHYHTKKGGGVIFSTLQI